MCLILASGEHLLKLTDNSKIVKLHLVALVQRSKILLNFLTITSDNKV